MKNKVLWIVICLPIAALLLAGCGTAQTAVTEPTAGPAEPAVAGPVTPVPASITVLASTTFLSDIAQNVAGERVVVESLLPPGADPHSYQAVPLDMAKIENSDVLILNGVEYEASIERLLENAGGERLVVEATTGLEPHQMADHAHVDEEEDSHEGEDHSPEAHSQEVCQQLEGLTAEEEIQSGIDAASAAGLHREEEPAEGEHVHEREIIQVKLNALNDGTYAGYLLFDSETEQGYTFTAQAGSIAVSDGTGAILEVGQNLTIDCAGMSVGSVYQLPAGEYVVALTGFSTETTVFSAAPMHPEGHSHEGHTETEDEHAGHNHAAGDPHMWLDPNLVITYVENIRDGLSQADPDGAETYAVNADAYISKIKDLDAFIREQVESIPAERRLLVTNHEAMGYFAERYGFEVVDSILPSFSSSASPSAQEVIKTVESIKASGAPAIFLGEVENTSLAYQIATETGIKVVNSLYLETLTDGDPAPTYIEMMKHNVTQIADALK